MAVKERISKLLEQLNEGIIEKEDVMALALLSSIAGESIFLLGPPGVAKSLIARQLKFAYKDASAFEYLMSRFSTPDEIFGPVSISGLKKDKYERIVRNYLPSATVVFLDEIWKAGPSIQNALLTILNEKIFRNGDEVIDPVPMKALISASNELPAQDQGLEALWDRFLVRFIVKGITNEEKFNEMISMSSNITDKKRLDGITDKEYEEWSKKIDQIKIQDNIFNIIHAVRNKLDLHNSTQEKESDIIYISDRRYRKIMRLLRTSAFLNDREEVDLVDCFLIKHCIWNSEDQEDIVHGIVCDAIFNYGNINLKNINELKSECALLEKDVNDAIYSSEDGDPELLTVYEEYYKILSPPSQYSKLIEKSEFNSLTNRYRQSKLFFMDHNDNKIKKEYESAQSYIPNISGLFMPRNLPLASKDPITLQIKKGKTDFSVIIDEVEYNLATTEQKRKVKRNPSISEKNDWDEKIERLFSNIEKIKKNFINYKSKTINNFRSNLFVNHSMENMVESVIIESEKSIEKIELDIKKIQHSYQIKKA